MTVEHLDSSVLTTLDAQPISVPTAGEGAPGLLRVVTDYIKPTAAGMASIGSTYRLCRIPVYAKIKSVVIDLGAVDTNASAAAVFDINLAFSDSAYDGTQVALQNLIPTTALTGATTSIATYSTPNIIFGTIAAKNSGVKSLGNEVVFGGSDTAWFPAGRELPLWDFFGFVNSQGTAQDPGGFFDLLLYLSTAAGTGASDYIGARVSYVV